MRLIDADAMLEYLDLMYDKQDDWREPYNVGVLGAINYIKHKAPTIDADRPKGEWRVIRKGYNITLVSCSNCGKRFRIPNYNFKSERTRWKCCPICCADMKGDNNEAD